MLELLRKYQRYLFIVITVMIIISFSFFGTYSTIDTNIPHEQTVFTTFNGVDVQRHELEELTVFISSDMQDKLLLGGMWGPNFFNDGIIRKNFLETGLGFMLAMNYPDELLKDLKMRAQREKKHTLYSHPQAGFINVESAWTYFAPQMKDNYNLLKTADNPMAPEALASRISLFLQERQFPAPLVKQVLRYQERQNSWLSPDPNLDYYDLSLFGYHTIEDWFGPRFVRLVAQFIINSARVAEQKGYKVTKEEVLADLMQHAASSYQQNIDNPNLGVANLQQYIDEQLRRMSMDQNKAVKVWRDVLLFRRLFNDVGNSVFVDPFSVEKIQAYAKEGISAKLYELPQELRLDNYRSMQNLEIYLNAVAVRDQGEKKLLMLPSTFLSLDEIAKKFPELIQRRYILDVAQVKKNDLHTRVGLKESWNWEVDDQNWILLQKKFPVLAMQKASTRQERFAILEGLDDKTRGKIDDFARSAIVDMHPEWIDEALQKAPLKSGEVTILEKGGKPPFVDEEKRQEVLDLLAKASLKGEAVNEAAQKLSRYDSGNDVFFRIVVVKRAPEREIVTFAEAEGQGVLDQLLDKELESYFVKIRESDSASYKKTDESWKPFSDVRDLVADKYFEHIRQAVEKDYKQAIAPEKAPPVFLNDFLASLRLYAYVRHIRDNLEKDDKALSKWVIAEKDTEEDFLKREQLKDQWKLTQTGYQGTRSNLNRNLNPQEIFAMDVGDWSKVNTPVNGDLNFLHLERRGFFDEKAVFEKVGQIYQALSADAQRMYMQKLLSQFKDKKAISLEYMNQLHQE